MFRRRKGGPLARKLWVDCGIVIYCWSKHGVYPKPLPVRRKSCSSRHGAAPVKRSRGSVPAEASYSPGELETSVAAATARRGRGCSGSPSELFAPVTAGAAQLRSSWKRPAPAERSRRAERSRKDCERRARRRAERPSFGASRGGSLRKRHRRPVERPRGDRVRERESPAAAACGAGGLPPTADHGEMRTSRERKSRNFPTQT